MKSRNWPEARNRWRCWWW